MTSPFRHPGQPPPTHRTAGMGKGESGSGMGGYHHQRPGVSGLSRSGPMRVAPTHGGNSSSSSGHRFPSDLHHLHPKYLHHQPHHQQQQQQQHERTYRRDDTVSPKRPRYHRHSEPGLGGHVSPIPLPSRISPPIRHHRTHTVTSTISTSTAVTSSAQTRSVASSSSSSAAVVASQPHYPPHFMRGSIIQLANGDLKRVEDLRTDDFANSADISPDLKIDSSQVVQIEEVAGRSTVILGFSVGDQKLRVSRMLCRCNNRDTCL